MLSLLSDPSITWEQPGQFGTTKLAWVLLGIVGLSLFIVVIGFHSTPLYGVETDLLGEALPAAKAIFNGTAEANHFLYKGPGYPLLLGSGMFLTGGDAYLAARILNVIAAVVAAWFAFLFFRKLLGGVGGLFVLVGLLLNPIFARATLEAGTDVPALALALGATYLLTVREGRWATWGIILSGLLAGLAVITRYNFLLLVIAALVILAVQTNRWKKLATYAAGLALPVGGWMIANWQLTGNPLTNQNYKNFAYELYGQGSSWDRFWANSSGSFNSFGEVLAFDPAIAFSTLAGNFATRWLQDIQELLPVAIGVLGILGILLLWLRAKGWQSAMLHFVLSYSILITVFYTPRFFVYLIPFYLAGAAAVLLLLRWPGKPGTGTGPMKGWAKNIKWGRLGLATVLLVYSGFLSVREVSGLLRDAPHEVRWGGEVIRGLHGPEGKVMARKPHVAYFADRDYVAFPRTSTLTELIEAGRTADARYLFFSPIEEVNRKQYEVLSEPGLQLPGLSQIHHQETGPLRYFAIYEFNQGIPSERAVTESLRSTIARQEAGGEGSGKLYTSVGVQLVQSGRLQEAIPYLIKAKGKQPRDDLVMEQLIQAYIQLKRYQEASAVCEEAVRLYPDRSWLHLMLGTIRTYQRRFPEAVTSINRAVSLEPARAGNYEILGQTNWYAGNYQASIEAFQRALSLDASLAVSRLYIARILRLRGDRSGALQMLEGGADPTSATYPQILALADSLRRGF